MNKNPVIEVRQVSKSFRNVRAVDGIDFKIFKGQSLALLGPNGAGKTTLMEMIEGIQPPDAGDILIKGSRWKGNEKKLHHIIGLSLQETRFIDRLTVFETLKLFAGFYDLPRNRVEETIHHMGLIEKRNAYVVNLSGGQRQRLALGISLLNNPEILLLDEPTTGLDPNARREIWAILRQLKAQSRTSLVLTTHYMEEAEQLCERIIIIDQGRILKQGTLEELLEAENSGKIMEFIIDTSCPPMDRSAIQSGFPVQWDIKGEKGRIVLKQMETELLEFLNFLNAHDLRLRHLECRRKTLDDLFTAMTGRRLNESPDE